MSDVPKVARRLSANLNTDANDSLEHLANTTRRSFTDIVNRALMIAALVERETSHGGQLMIREAGGDLRAVTIL